jgi:hypothetical protein
MKIFLHFPKTISRSTLLVAALAGSLPVQAADVLLDWNFESCQPGQPVGIVDPPAAAKFQVPLERVDSQPIAVADGPAASNPPLAKSAEFDARQKQFLRSRGLGKPFMTAEGQPFTVEAWVKVGEDPAANGYICSNRDPSRGFTGFGMYLVNKDGLALPGFIVTSWDQSVGIVSSEPLEPAKWHHIAATRDEAGVVALFLDGIEVAHSQNRTQPGQLDGYVNLTVGRSPHSQDDDTFWNGQIAAIRVSDSVLAPADFLLVVDR